MWYCPECNFMNIDGARLCARCQSESLPEEELSDTPAPYHSRPMGERDKDIPDEVLELLEAEEEEHKQEGI